MSYHVKTTLYHGMSRLLYVMSCQDYIMSWHNDIWYIMVALDSTHNYVPLTLCKLMTTLPQWKGYQLETGTNSNWTTSRRGKKKQTSSCYEFTLASSFHNTLFALLWMLRWQLLNSVRDQIFREALFPNGANLIIIFPPVHEY